jgi:probable phosphoglycerate mutase
MEATRLIIVRHGETQWNLEGRRQGHLDSPLTPKGRAQAQALGQRFKAGSCRMIYSSDLGRAYHTAKAIAARTGNEVVPDERLRERHLGIFQGLNGDEIRARYPDEYEKHRRGGPDHAVPGGESFSDQACRNLACLEELATQYAGETIMIVTHGGVLSALFRHTFGIPLDAPRRFTFKNASVNSFVYQDGVWSLETWGDICHLDDPGALDLSYF